MEEKITKENLIYENNTIRISSFISDYGFHLLSLDEYKQLFKTLIEKEILTDNSFENNVWIANDLSSKSKFFFRFNKINNPNLNIALKAYSVSFLQQGFSVSHVQTTVNNFIKLSLLSDSFSEILFSQFIALFNSFTPRQRENYALSAIRIYEFYQEALPKIYFDFFKSIPPAERKVRDLPDYNSILAFDEIVNSFIQSANKTEKKQFYPIFIWWKITTVIPTRPEEFVSFTYNCNFEKDSSYWITLPRKKIRNSNNSLIKIEDTLQIPKDLFMFIEDYKALLDEDEKSEFLFSYMSYFKFIKETHKEQSLKRRIRVDRMDKGQMMLLLNEFFEKIVKERYKEYNIHKINLGDTRHFAFCNMMLQGLNMLTIARIGGHQSLKAQVHYSQHLDFFAESKIKVLSEQIKRNRIKNIGEVITPEINSLIVRSKINKKEGLKVKYGYCNDSDFPSNCISDCLFCPFFQVDLSQKNIIQELLSKSNQIGRNISEQIETMRRLSIEMFYDLQTMQYSEEEQEKLLSISRKLENLIKNKAIVDSYIEEELEHE